MSSVKTVYLDYAASAPARECSLEAERRYASADYAGANPNSLHSMGRLAARALDQARADLARCLGGRFRPAEVTFTSGGTESNNIALFGLSEGARERDRKRTKVIISAIEHDSVLDVASPLRALGFEVVLARPGRDGKISCETLDALVGPDTALVSIMYANNETGVVQPVPELAAIAHRSGALFHTDAVQGFGRIPLDLSAVDAVSCAAHKIGGPVGAAAKECAASLEASRGVTARRARELYARLCAPGTGIKATVGVEVGADRLPGMVSILVPSLDSETLVLALDEAGYEVSAGSACSSGSLDPSHVLSAMGIPRQEALGSLRVSFDERVEPSDLESFADALLNIVSSRSSNR